MPHINPDNREESQPTPESTFTTLVTNVSTPMIICGVNRKLSIGHYETVDIYCGVSLPLVDFNMDNMVELKDKLSDLASEAFMITSRETGERYDLIKQALKSGRTIPEQDEPF